MDELILNKVGSVTVHQKTGRTWQDWIHVLDSDGCQSMSHKEIAAMLSSKYQVEYWWCQMVTVGYEQFRGLRDVHQKKDGYSASVNKTMPFTSEQIYAAWMDPVIRGQWMQSNDFEFRKTTENRIIRLKWKDGSSVEVNLYAKANGKTQVSVQHNKLASSELVIEMKAFWSENLTGLLNLMTR